jgi:hypothetical protein
MSMDPSIMGVDLRIAQLYGEAMVGTTWPRVHPHGPFSLMEWVDVTAEKGLK